MTFSNTKNQLRRYFFIVSMFSGISLYAQTKIILKLDDLEAKQSSIDACVPTFEYLVNNGIKAGWGVMRFGNATESQIATLKLYAEKKNVNGEALVEIWHHGLEHSKDNPLGTLEFSGTSYAYQKSHFDSTARLLKNLLGVTVYTFGAPYNHIDATLLQVMGEDPNMKVIMLGQQTPAPSTGIMNLSNRVNMESATGVVNFQYFLANYNSKKSIYKDYMVLQGHPPKWVTDSLREEFRKIIAFLISEGCEFVTPYEYYCSVNNRNPDASHKIKSIKSPRSLNHIQYRLNFTTPKQSILPSIEKSISLLQN